MSKKEAPQERFANGVLHSYENIYKADEDAGR